jgi:hypothetical protein
MSQFKLGEVTDKIYCGDLASQCEYLADLGEGRMLFYDITSKCFRRVFPQWENNKYILNGWACAPKPSQLL